MPITTAQLKAAIEAKIAAANGSTSLEDLTLIKNNADTWLANNSGGTITGYAPLETLIQNKQDALTSSSTIDDVTLTSAAVFPPSVSKNLVWKTQTFLTSGTFTRPAKMAGDTAWVTASAGGGGGVWTFADNVRGAFGGCWCKDRAVNVPVGSSHTVVIGSGGTANQDGGNTLFGTQIELKGGSRAYAISSGVISFGLTSENRMIFFKGVGVHPGVMAFLQPYSSTITSVDNSTTAIIIPPDFVNGYQGVGYLFSGAYEQLNGTGPAAGYFGNPASNYGPSPANTGCGGWSGGGSGFPPFAGSAGRLDIGWWEYE